MSATEERFWIAERRMRAVKTIVVSAASRKETKAKLDRGEVECVAVTYYGEGRPRVVRLGTRRKKP